MALFGTKPTITLGSKFKNICFIGLNRVEFMPDKTEDAIFGDTWQDVTDEQTRKKLCLAFFAPRELDGEPVNPFAFLAGEEADDEDAGAMMRQAVEHMPLLDLCRMAPATVNTVNILVVADVIYHWDVNDNYVQPTTQYSWGRDIKQILKAYARNIDVNIYTNWPTDQMAEVPKGTMHPVRSLPLDPEVWINMPTFQEQWGTHVLVASLLLACGVYGVLYLQQQKIDKISEQIRIVQQQIPRESRFASMAQAINEQEKHMQPRALFPYIVKDMGHAIHGAQMKIENLEVKNPRPQDPPENLLVTIEAEKDAYQGWLEEEPVAKALLLNSATLKAIRKPPGNTFKLEGLIDLSNTLRTFQEVIAQQKRDAQSDTPTRNVLPEQPEGDAS